MLFRRSVPDLPRGGEVRRADRRDVGRLVELWLELMNLHAAVDSRFVVREDAGRTMARRFSELLTDPDTIILVSQSDGEMVGFAVAHIDINLPFLPGTTVGFISDIYVLDAYRRQGRAARLVAAMRDWFKSRKVTVIQLHAASCNPAAQQFWERMGFSDYLVRMWGEV